MKYLFVCLSKQSINTLLCSARIEVGYRIHFRIKDNNGIRLVYTNLF